MLILAPTPLSPGWNRGRDACYRARPHRTVPGPIRAYGSHLSDRKISPGTKRGLRKARLPE